MNSEFADRRIINRLFAIRNRFGGKYAEEKLTLLLSLHNAEATTCQALERLHAALCFIRAFPDTRAHHKHALLQLGTIEGRVSRIPSRLRSGLWDSGIVGTPIHYSFSFEVASWLSKRARKSVSIDWDDIDDTSMLDELLNHLMLPAEEDYFGSGYSSSQEWIELSASASHVTDFDWLFAQLGEKRFRRFWSQLYDESELSLVWELHNAALSKTNNAMQVARIHYRSGGMRKRIRAVKTEILRPLRSLHRLPSRSGAKLIDVAMTSLAVRHRETNHFNFANPNEVYLADVGQGVSIAVFGMREEHRYPLECTMGYLILSNGVPIGYGGGSALFRQVNAGINIFDEFRGSEAAFLWTQVMRVYHALFACTRFIVNAYQFGNDNSEALASGAFWFYYRLGYRPVLAETRALARRESLHAQKNEGYRCDRKTLQRLAACDMHLTLPGACASDLFDERWIETSSMLATTELAAVGAVTRAGAAKELATQVALELRMRVTDAWSDAEKSGFRQLAPFIAAARPATWSQDDKRTMRKISRAKGSACEANYARRLSQHGAFLSALRRACRRADGVSIADVHKARQSKS